MKKLELFVSAVLAGILISISGALYIGSGGAPVGAVLFSVALFTICTRGMGLFTGRVGDLVKRADKAACVLELAVIWAGNLAGCIVTGAAMAYAKPAYRDTAMEMAAAKLGESPLQAFLLAVLCGILMYIAVDHFRSWQGDLSRFLGIFLCIPAFILAGFEHVVADMFFLSLGIEQAQLGQTVLFLLICTLGNACGAWILPGWEKLRQSAQAG